MVGLVKGRREIAFDGEVRGWVVKDDLLRSVELLVECHVEDGDGYDPETWVAVDV